MLKCDYIILVSSSAGMSVVGQSAVRRCDERGAGRVMMRRNYNNPHTDVILYRYIMHDG